MYNQKITSKFVKYKSERLKKYNLIIKLRLMIILRAFSRYGKCVYPELLLIEKALSRAIFMLDVEQGDEVSIPR